MNEIVYSPRSPQRGGLAVWRGMFADLIASRELIWRLVLRDLQGRYGKSVFSYLWLVLTPALSVAIPVFLISKRIVPMADTPLPYAAFVLVNIVVWQLFAQCLQSCATCLNRAGALVTRVNFPKAALVFAAAGQPLAEFFIKLPLVAVAFALMKTPASWHSAQALLLIAPLLLIAVGTGFFLAVLSLAARDVNHALGPLLMALMFLSPVLYPAPTQPPFSILNFANPLSPILTAQQHLIASATVPEPGLLLGSVAFAAAVFALGWRTFHVAMPRLAERA
jgi:lipopolysaccharide transport system permease protein